MKLNKTEATEADIKADAAQQSPTPEPKDATIISVASLGPEAEDSEVQQNQGTITENNCNKCLERWEKYLVAVPFTIAITVMGASWSAQGINKDIFNPTSYVFALFILVVLLNFYMSVFAIILSYFLPDLYRVFLVAAFFCALVSLTILFSALLPGKLYVIPWTVLSFILLTCLFLVVHGRPQCNSNSACWIPHSHNKYFQVPFPLQFQLNKSPLLCLVHTSSWRDRA